MGFWKHFGLKHVFIFAYLFKNAAYNAYTLGRKKTKSANPCCGLFREVCDKAWAESILDFNALSYVFREEDRNSQPINDWEKPYLDEDWYPFLIRFFPVKHMIFPAALPSSIFNYINGSTHYTFHIWDTITPIHRPIRKINTIQELTIHDHSRTNQTQYLNIITAIKNLNKLKLIRFRFDALSVYTLRLFNLTSLFIHGCSLPQDFASEFVDSILKNRLYLESITIHRGPKWIDRNQEVKKAIKLLLRKIFLFKNLKALTVTIDLWKSNLDLLWKARKIKSLRYLEVRTNDFIQENEKNKLIEIFEEDLPLKMHIHSAKQPRVDVFAA